MNTAPHGTFIGRYKGVNFYAHHGKYNCLFGWAPKEFDSIRALKCAVTRWEKS